MKDKKKIPKLFKIPKPPPTLKQLKQFDADEVLQPYKQQNSKTKG